MSLTLQKKNNVPVAVIHGGANDGTKIYLDTAIPGTEKGKKLEKGFPSVKIDDGVFRKLVDTSKEREVGVVVGASGSGKSTWVKSYCQEYRKTFKNREIYMFSNLAEDPTLDAIKLKRIRIDESLVSDPLSCEDFRDSLVLFDDVDVIASKPLKEAVYSVMNQILETGRHFNTSCIMTSHLCNGPNMKRILNESHFMVYFPWSANRQCKYVLENYIGIDVKVMAKIKSTKSRWCCVFKNYPQCCLCERNIFLLAEEV
jgi:energy-coupling factor transporter ATP-binding protein EcfA2